MPNQRRILILRAGFLQQFLCKRAKELGLYVMALDGDADSEGFAYADKTGIIRVADEDACLQFARENQPDGVVTAANDFGIISMSRIAEEQHLPGVNVETAKIIKNKAKVRKALYEAHVDDSDCFYEITETASLEEIKALVRYPLMVKPSDGSGSRGVSKATSFEELQMACENALAESDSHSAVIETFVEGREYGVESFVDNDIHVLAVMQKDMTKPPYFAELGHASESGLPTAVEERVKECVKKAIKALNINFGCVNMDVIVTETGSVHIIDIGVRMGGNLIGSHLIPMGTGIDYMGNIIKATLGEKVSWEPTMVHKPTATRLIVLTPGKIESLPDIEEMERKYDVEIVHHLSEGATIREYHANRDGFGYIVAQGETIEEAKAKAKTVLQVIDNMIIDKNTPPPFRLFTGK